MAKRIIVFLILLLSFVQAIPAAGKFQVVFLADVKYASDPLWLQQVKKWGATGITLRIHRSFVEQQYHQYNFTDVERAATAIAAAKLDMFLRISTTYINGAYADRYSKDDYHQTRGGEIIYNQNADRPLPLLNLTSERAFGDQVAFFLKTAEWAKRTPAARRIKTLLPALVPDDETEYPLGRWGPPGWGWLTGYSRPEQEAFMRFLRIRYNGSPDDERPDSLNTVWHSGFSSISTAQIRIDEYDWERLRPKFDSYPAGRKDFLDFRGSQLKRYIDTCASIATKGGFRMGIQLGSIYDEGLELRSTYDVTPIVENVGLLIVDDIADMSPNFDFVSDYERSLGRYWDWRKHRSASRSMIWGTETNWPGYNHIDPDTLVRLWKDQLETARLRGASVLSVAHWGTEDGVVPWNTPEGRKLYTIAELVRVDSVDKENRDVMSTAYAEWRKELLSVSGTPVIAVHHTTSVHLSCEQILYSEGGPGDLAHTRNFRLEVGNLPTFDGSNRGTLPLMLFPLKKIAKAKNPWGGGEPYNGHTDLVTNFMIIRSPEYLKTYSAFTLDGTSRYMPDSVYKVLSSGLQRAAGNTASAISSASEVSAASGRIDEYGRQHSASELARRVQRQPNLTK